MSVIKKLRNLSRVLKSVGFDRESDLILGVIKKAFPMRGVHGGSAEVGELGHDNYEVNATSEEWIESIKNVAANIVLIHVDYDKITQDPDILQKFKDLFGYKEGSHSAEEQSQVINFGAISVLIGLGNSCPVGEFAAAFPGMSNIFNKYPKDYVFALWDTSDYEFAYRGPKWIGHDLHHISEDRSSDSRGNNLIHTPRGQQNYIFETFMKKITDCYTQIEISDNKCNEFNSYDRKFLFRKLFGEVILPTTIMGDENGDLVSFISRGGKLSDVLSKDIEIVEYRNYIGCNIKLKLTKDRDYIESLVSELDQVLKKNITGQGAEDLVTSYIKSNSEYDFWDKSNGDVGKDLVHLQQFEGRVLLLP